jgi:hypothetical protein
MKFLKLIGIVSASLSCFMFAQTVGAQDWNLQHPGAGGQHQSITADPNNAGRLYITIDVNGVYRSDDFGDSWKHFYTDAAHGFCFYLGVEPGAPNRLYSGNFWGVDISDDAGKNWATVALPVPSSLNQNGGDSIAWIAINPSNTNKVYASPGWKSKDAEKGKINVIDPLQGLTGPRNIYVSGDRGATWTSEVYESQDGYRQVYSMEVHPTNGKLYVGAHSGVYLRNGPNSYTRLPVPAGAIDGLNDNSTRREGAGCRGIALSPDGQYLYALWTVQKYMDDNGIYNQVKTAPFVLNLSTSVWTNLETVDLSPAEWGYPKVDPRSDVNEHKLIFSSVLDGPSPVQETGGKKGRVGLFEGTIGFLGGAIDSYSWLKIGDSDGLDNFSYEAGWENRAWKVRGAVYSPTSWPERQIFASGGQNLFRTATTGTGFPLNDWVSVYSQKVGDHYTNRGYASTVSFDADALSNYSIIGSADLGAFESYDGGQTWTDLPLNAQSGLSTLIVDRQNETPTVFATYSAGFGATGEGGGLYYKELTTFSETDSWVYLGGIEVGLQKTTPKGQIGDRGLPNLKYSDIAFNPANNSLYIATKPGDATTSTIYRATDIFALMDDPLLSFAPIQGQNTSLITDVTFSSIHVDPVQTDLLWVARGGEGGGLVLGDNTSGWDFTKIDLNDDQGNPSSADAVEYN